MKYSRAERNQIDLEERSIREMVRIHRPQNPERFADEFMKRNCYGTKYKRMVQVIESEMLKLMGDGVA